MEQLFRIVRVEEGLPSNDEFVLSEMGKVRYYELSDEWLDEIGGKLFRQPEWWLEKAKNFLQPDVSGNEALRVAVANTTGKK